jgi:hypothetical protein
MIQTLYAHMNITKKGKKNLNVNNLNFAIKRHRLADFIIKQYLSVCCLQETHFTGKGTHIEIEQIGNDN